jgi:type II secretory pathway component HofQ
LLLKQKEAELAILQAEVNRLRQCTGEIKANAELRVTVRIVDIHDQVEGSVADASRRDDSWKNIEDMIKAGKATLACEPSLIVVSKQTAQFDRGSEILKSAVTQAGSSESREFGITVNVAPVIVEGNRIRVQVYAERSVPDSSDPGIIGRNRVQSTIEVMPGQTYVIARCITTAQDPLSSEMMIRGTVFAISIDVIP